jgi:hypothetical protein
MQQLVALPAWEVAAAAVAASQHCCMQHAACPQPKDRQQRYLKVPASLVITCILALGCAAGSMSFLARSSRSRPLVVPAAAAYQPSCVCPCLPFSFSLPFFYLILNHLSVLICICTCLYLYSSVSELICTYLLCVLPLPAVSVLDGGAPVVKKASSAHGERKYCCMLLPLLLLG